MSDKYRVLIVDDSTDDIHFVMENLKQDYAVLVATSGEKAVEMAAKNPRPDVILMDVEMPGMNGYETCRQLKATTETSATDVIFVSAHDSTEGKLAGYDAGGSDYLIKPVQTSELLQKVKLAIKNKEARTAVEADKAMAMETAMTAISSAGEQGVVVNFMKNSFSVTSIEELARLVVDATSSYGLESSVQLRTAASSVNASSKEPIPPLEQELLSKLKDVGRLKESGTRFIGNFGGVTQLIKNMPEDEDKRGRLRDHLALLLEGAEARLHALEMQQQLAQLVTDSNQTLQDIEAMQQQQKQTSMQIMDDVMQKLEASFLSYGLTEEQEALLFKVVQDGVDKSLNNFEQGMMIDEKMRDIIRSLERFSQA